VKLYIMRHGDAVPSQAMSADQIRPLSQLGEREVITNAQWLRTQLSGEQLDWVITSPYIRAQQTATVLHSVLPSTHQSISDDLVPEADARLFVAWLAAMLQAAPCDQVLVVSHMPLDSYLVAEIDASKQPPIFPTAGIAGIEFDAQLGQGQLEQIMIVERCG